MYPEVIEYFDAKSEMANKIEEFEREQRRLQPRYSYTEEDSSYHRKYSEWSEKYYEGQRKLSAEQNKVNREARNTLRTKTKDPMIHWMIDKLSGGYGGYVDSVLKILPATRDELETLANQDEWCSEFDEFLGQATEAGVVPPADQAYDAQEIIDWVSDEFDVYGRRYRRDIQVMVNRIVEKALAEKATADAAEHNSMVTV
jgi:hypothetical protein